MSTLAALVVLLVVIGWGVVGGGEEARRVGLLRAPDPTVAPTPPIGAPAGHAAAGVQAAGSIRPVEGIEEALFVKGSLRGIDLPAWGVAAGERLVPNRALRDRFDDYLLALSEASVDELTALVRAHAKRDLGDKTAEEVLAVWRNYLQLQQHQFSFSPQPGDLSSMQVSLQEHRQVRQAILGVHWAQAFYGEEEKVLAAQIERARTGESPRAQPDVGLLQPAPGTDAAVLHRQRAERFGAEAADRLQALDQQEALWNERVAAARRDIDAIRRDPGLSDTQRDAAIGRTLDRAFPDAAERLRAAGIVGL